MANKNAKNKERKERGVYTRKDRPGYWVRLTVNGLQRTYRCDTRSQAKALYGRLKADAREGIYFPDRFKAKPALTLRAWIKRYREGITSPGLRNMHHYGSFWSKLLGRQLLKDISADDLRRLQAKMLKKGNRTPQTINRYFAALRRILNLAITEGHLSVNPVRAVKFFREPVGRLRYLSNGEITRLRETMAATDWPIVAFSLETGLRLSEQFKARWECVELERGVLTVPLSKSGRTRHVILSETAIAILRNLSSWMHSPYLFPSPLNAGQPMQGRHFVVKIYTPALERAKIQGATWHTLRHSFASRAVMAGVDIRTVQELMGHSTITMTMWYAHLSPAHLRDAVNKASLPSVTTAAEIQTKTVTTTVTTPSQGTERAKQETREVLKNARKRSGGAGRVRTAASQFCRLLP
jgi:integrase